MDLIATQPLRLLPRHKVLHLVRHAQGVHNVEAEKNHEALMLDYLVDAQLSPLGWQQVANLRKHFRSTGLLRRVDLVITSPMLRTLQTAAGVFNTKDHEDSLEAVASSMEEIAGNEHQRLPILANELCRERLGIHPCNKRRSINDYRPLFPEIDFSLVESDDDNLWSVDVRETYEEVGTRGIKFIKWLMARKEKEIAVVSHGVFLQQTLIALGNMCYSAKTQEIKRFANCEVRSVVIVDENAMVMVCSSCERIPRRLQLLNDSARDKDTTQGTHQLTNLV